MTSLLNSVTADLQMENLQLKFISVSTEICVFNELQLFHGPTYPRSQFRRPLCQDICIRKYYVTEDFQQKTEKGIAKKNVFLTLKNFY